MHRLAFDFSMAMRGLRRLRLIQLVVAVSLALALVMPCVAIALIRDARVRGTQFEVPHPERTLLVAVPLPLPIQPEQAEALFATGVPIARMSYSAFGRALVANPDAEIAPDLPTAMPPLQSIHGMTPGDLDARAAAPISGRNFSEADYAGALHACVLGSSMARLFGVEVGASLFINGIRYEVIGILDSEWEKTVIRVPYGRFEDIQTAGVQHTFIVEYEQEPDWAALRESLSGKVARVIQFETIANLNRAHRERLLASHRDVLLLAFATTLIAAINLVFVMQGRVKSGLRGVAVRLALGARARDVFLEMLCGNLALLACALPLMLPIAKFCLARTIGGTGVQLSVMIVAEVAGIGALLVLALSLMMMASVKRLSVVAMLRRGK